MQRDQVADVSGLNDFSNAKIDRVETMVEGDTQG